jgi:hypothetical protein
MAQWDNGAIRHGIVLIASIFDQGTSMVESPIISDETKLASIFERYRDYVKHQYDLTNHRTTWFVTMNAFLFTTFGFTIQKKLEILARPEMAAGCTEQVKSVCAAISEVNLFMIALCMVASFSAFVAFILIESARRPIVGIAEKWEELIGIKEIQSEHMVQALRSREWLLLVGGMSRRAAYWGRIATPLFPAAISVAWPLICIFTGLLRPDFNQYSSVLGNPWFLALIFLPFALIVFNVLLYATGIRIMRNPTY